MRNEDDPLAGYVNRRLICGLLVVEVEDVLFGSGGLVM
jgi:hypothetical protein